ncbi:hypothetical protein BATDEDRAFT_92813 [Batrachochytrium dendrobatidis JAM81]|uniref:Dynein regulatory complex subunit 3 n=2 Tax=Batrachochytrium dendrobatidis TaxID=109871 RepID=F4PEN2_BATDJ|nr:uncharacterized protein BATDEDRAFT_92813 [Batrachochytrium dendrobatidis JAM81]EGF76279.1 hypothetical protein BATDEDRAFT_92813 [Batrachochytrium dendrobatidis JAM81]KAK5666425.1 hypothetical protein QVD99_007181 [Batrachochytrium dendrobatidis]OAJ43018.1 hypothetical protein BDEG_26401 [Batrachochytrium dendrobatidis JEL423]|eukprot:XP_006683104.1 hypothetical protein BATDEDRAFT_92813 [Batrachochytrium dendrobatidis JAM81]
MSNYNNTEPVVIDEELVRKAINEQLPSEIADIAWKEGVEASQVTTLRLDYKNILKIDNLWIYSNMTKLQLDNNIIEKIENIKFLKSLQWLDLSFNNITVIEGLEGLEHLTDLTLFNNRISKIENMDDLVNLKVFSIGNNCIPEIENLAYLLKFENLRVLNVAGNALCKNPNYKPYCLAHLKNLKYLDYRLVDEESLKAAHEKYIDSIIAQEEEEKVILAKREKLRKHAELDAVHEKAHILHIEILFDSMFNDDPDFQKLIPIAPSIIYEMREEFRAKFDIIIKELKHFVLKKSQEKAKEIQQLHKCIDNVKGASDDLCMQKFQKFQHTKKEYLKTVLNSRNAKEVDEALKTLREDTHLLFNHLMSAEMIIVEQFEEVLKEFERNYTELCSIINETGQTSFSRLRDLENEHQEKFLEAILVMYERFNKGDADEVDDEIRDIMSDKDVLMNAINASHDFRLGKLDHQEDELVTGVAKDQDQIIKKTHDDEVRRNRNRICEIIAFLDKTNQEIDNAEENAY